jgi:LacI family transcriptional regulator, galactose operon repressor
MAPTIKEVAARARVSVTTVSRVLNDYPFVSDAARERVTEAMEALDYRPDMAARSMRTGTTRAVGFVVSDITNPVFAAIAKGADAVLHPHGYSLVLANSGGDPEHETELIAALRQRRVDGLIAAVADERSPGLAERLSRVPACVLFDREVSGATADAVCSDHANGMESALGHLAALGHARVGLVAGRLGQLGSRGRVEAFASVGRRLGLDGDPQLVVTGRLSRETGYRGARELLELREPPTALVAGNNQLTVGVVQALREAGVRLPTGLSLVACDDIDLTRMHEPPIDVIERDPEKHGRAAAELLLSRLDDPHAPPRRVVLPTSFVRRGSTDVPRVVVGAGAR